ncbi:MAG: DUF4147 domain-containing protein, partial [Haloferacaceae archaeon]
MFDNRAELDRSSAHGVALDCLQAGIRAAHPESITRQAVSLSGTQLRVGPTPVDDGVETIDLASYDEVLVLGGGKAAASVAVQLEEILGSSLSGGVVVTDRDPDRDQNGGLDRISVRYGSHPVPDEAGVEGAREVLQRVSAADEKTLVIGVVTGGGSALLPAPADGISLRALRQTTDALLEAGATIH